ncbi:MAG: tRNA (adenosine(37)-N6)-threonylcarbamoyltransferase complex dimerization subunit type 1 TsaB [Gemmatimonadota bacterium]
MSGREVTTATGVLVALDTSGPFGSVAVAREGTTSALVTLSERQQHAARLIPAIDEALHMAAVSRADVTGIVVGEGPGSFTGVRVAAATAKGLAHSLRVPLWAVSSLLAAALAGHDAAVRYVLFDARGERVYGACYGVGTAGVQEIVPPHGGSLRDVLVEDMPAGVVFLGDGAEKHRAAIEGAGFPVVPATRDTLAEGLLRYTSLHPELAAVEDPSAWEPLYVRASSAERLWNA